MSFNSRLLKTFLVVSAFATSALAATNPHVTAHPQARITQKVDAKSVVQLSGTVPGKISIATDLGRAGAGVRMSHLHLLLKSSDEQLAALDHLIDEQQDKASPNFHQWLTPETFASAFGIDSTDLAKVQSWMTSAGLSVDAVVSGGRVITFSGPVSAIESAFHTEIHSYQLNGKTQLANAKEVSIPSALASVVAGPARLNDFPATRKGSFTKVVRGPDGKFHKVLAGTKDTPDWTAPIYNGDHFVAPGDFATIYNSAGLIAAGTNGKGIKIGIVAETLVDLADTQIFRNMFQLPNNDPIITATGAPLQVDPDDFESDLDIQWSGAVAPEATIYFSPNGLGEYTPDYGVDGSLLNFVNNNVVDIISMSYGECEASAGSALSAYWNSMYAQAASQGQSVFVSSGDSSATGCTADSSLYANRGTYGVSGWGSSAYNVSVGGTMFNEGGYINGLATGALAPYWNNNSAAPYNSALTYIPEYPMSDGAFNEVYGGNVMQQYYGIFGGGGGVSQFVARPSWQTGVGISPTADPAGPTFTASGAIKTGLHRLVPDVSLLGSVSHDDVMICSEGSCVIDPVTGQIDSVGLVGGTSVAAPAWAGVMALIDQANGGRQGNPNYYFYKLAAAEPNLANCASVAQPATPVNTTCNFNDIVAGNNYSPITSKGMYIAPVLDSTGTTIVTPGYIQGTFGTDYIGFAAGTGYDEATGLGSPNVANLAKNWKTVTFNSSATTLTATPTTTTHGKAVAVTVNVTSASGTPTGTVAILEPGVNGGTPDVLNLTNGVATGNLVNLPGGTYNLIAQYSGDGTFGSSQSIPVSITIAKENSVMTQYFGAFSTATGALSNTKSLVYGQVNEMAEEIYGASAASLNVQNAPNTGVPTGTLTYSLVYTPTGGTATTLAPLTVTLDSEGFGYLTNGPFGALYVVQNYPMFGVGSYTATVSYSGDNSFNPTSLVTPFTVSKASSTPTLTINTPNIVAGSAATVTIKVPAIFGGVDALGNLIQTSAFPSGQVNLVNNAGGAVLGTAQLGVGGQVTFNTSALAAGTYTVYAAYLGDSNYNPVNQTRNLPTITVTATGTAPTVTLAVSPQTIAAGAIVLNPETLTATVPTGTTGSVSFFEDGNFLTSVRIGTGATTATYTSDAFTAATDAAPHVFTAEYSGSTALPAATSAPVNVSIDKNKPYLTLNATGTNVTGAPVVLQAAFNPQPYFSESTGAPVVPTQNVTFYDNGSPVGSAPLVFGLNWIQYTASLTLTPGSGSHSYTASYPGDANYYPVAATPPVAVASSNPTVTYALNPPRLTIPAGQAGLTTLTITGTAYWAGTVSVACTGAPLYAFCETGATSVTLTGQTSFYEPKTVAISVVTAPVTPVGSGSLMWIPAVFFAGFLFLRRKHLSLRGRQLLTLVVMVCGITALSGCGTAIQHVGVQGGTPLGTYNLTVTVTATGSTSASPSGTQTLTLPVTVVKAQ